MVAVANNASVNTALTIETSHHQPTLTHDNDQFTAHESITTYQPFITNSPTIHQLSLPANQPRFNNELTINHQEPPPTIHSACSMNVTPWSSTTDPAPCDTPLLKIETSRSPGRDWHRSSRHRSLALQTGWCGALVPLAGPHHAAVRSLQRSLRRHAEERITTNSYNQNQGY